MVSTVARKAVSTNLRNKFCWKIVLQYKKKKSLAKIYEK